MKVTVITVVLNAADKLRGTIESVLMQDYDNIEYIIKDGGSSDGTVDVIKEAAAEHDIIKYVSSPDSGIYDAMNVALDMTTGDVVEFLNAGDRFVSPNVVSKAVCVMRDTGSDIAFGDVLYENPDGTTQMRIYPQSCAKKIYYLTGDVINHQVMFFSNRLFDEYRFDTSFKICADREWMMRIGAYTPNRKMTALGFAVAIYPLDGVSAVNKEGYRKEADECIKRHMPAGYPIFALFEFIRAHKGPATVLHNLYKKLYIKR